MVVKSASDTFSGSGPLGVTETGGLDWLFYNSTAQSWSRSSGQAVTSAGIGSGAMAVVDLDWPDVDISVDTVGGGECVYFRVVDGGMWTRVRYHVTAEYVYDPGPWIYTETRMVEYDPGGGPSNVEAPADGVAVYYYPPNQYPQYQKWVRGAWYGSGYYYDIYERDLNQSIVYHPSFVVEQSVNGTVSTLGTVTMTTDPTRLRVIARTGRISVYRDAETDPLQVFAQSQYVSANQHGIGLAGPTDRTSTGLDNFNLARVGTKPNAPTLLGPTGGGIVNTTNTYKFTWQFSDPDPGDAQSVYSLRYRPIGAATWTTIQKRSRYSSWTAPAGTFVDGTDYEWQAQTTDTVGLVGPWSGSAQFTAYDPPPGPQITYPVDGGAVPQTIEVTWSQPSQDSWQLDVLDETGVVLQTLGNLSTTDRSASVTFDQNNVARTLRLTTKENTIESPPTEVTVQVSYTPPAPAIVTFYGLIRSMFVVPTQPTPVTGQPAVVAQDIWVRVAGKPATEKRVAAGLGPADTFEYRFPTSKVEYEARVVVYGDNGTSTVGDWVA